jgi:hypothetical protein
MMSDPIESAIDAEHSRQERAWDEAMTDIRADLEEVPGLVERLNARCKEDGVLTLFAGDLINPNGPEAADKLERLAAEVRQHREFAEWCLSPTFDPRALTTFARKALGGS